MTSESNEWNEPRVATAGQGTVRIRDCCEGMQKEEKSSVTLYRSVLYFSKVYSETRDSPTVLLYTEREG